jgi:hypothetical protein
MTVDEYLEHVRSDGPAVYETCKQIVEQSIFPIAAILVLPEGDVPRPVDEIKDWLTENYPDVRYSQAYGGVDWFLDDLTAAMHFKLYWC